MLGVLLLNLLGKINPFYLVKVFCGAERRVSSDHVSPSSTLRTLATCEIQDRKDACGMADKIISNEVSSRLVARRAPRG